MTMTDPIADMLTRIRNAIRIRAQHVDVPLSQEKLAVARVLLREGYIAECRPARESVQGQLRVYLKYAPNGSPVISHISRVSRPGRRIYRTRKELAPVLNGIGIAVVSTSQGIMSDREARQKGIGGEIICKVY